MPSGSSTIRSCVGGTFGRLPGDSLGTGVDVGAGVGGSVITGDGVVEADDVSTGSGVGVPAGVSVGSGVGLTVGLGVGCAVGLGVGLGVGLAVGRGVGLGVGFTVGFGVAAGPEQELAKSAVHMNLSPVVL